ncbi:hypothetical protein AKJ09_00225 [Labilithrix luteola]|uniref:Uncharacterized protein n=1 Tax=Labilithrix luteola TaxID=1391654 RepID=A0A0K1PJH5_9BACT|nr:hypothetical protein AKJ09_00225 [Labilithrix luteola]
MGESPEIHGPLHKSVAISVSLFNPRNGGALKAPCGRIVTNVKRHVARGGDIARSTRD